MSGCPEKDLHSVYLDGELPEFYLKEYESHVQTCQKCQAVLEKMRKVRALLHDSEISCKDENEFLEQSFERLQTKLRYTQNVKKPQNNIYSYTARFILPLTAAAAIFAVVFTPIHLKTTPVDSIKAIATRTEITPIAENKLVIDGNIEQHKVAEAISITENEEKKSVQQKVVPATSLASTGGNEMINRLNSVDVFRPDFKNSEPPVRIEVPNMHTIPMNRTEDFEER